MNVNHTKKYLCKAGNVVKSSGAPLRKRVLHARHIAKVVPHLLRRHNRAKQRDISSFGIPTESRSRDEWQRRFGLRVIALVAKQMTAAAVLHLC